MKIDLVYLWIEDNQELINKRKLYYNKTELHNNTKYEPIWDKNSYFQLNELKYSLRSVEKYMMSFIRNVYIVTDNQKPDFINILHPNIFIVDHKDIIPPEFYPTFNPNVIESYIHNIKGLSDYYLVMNDDHFINKYVTLNTFLYKENQNNYQLIYYQENLWNFLFGRLFTYITLKYNLFLKYFINKNDRGFFQLHENPRILLETKKINVNKNYIISHVPIIKNIENDKKINNLFKKNIEETSQFKFRTESKIPIYYNLLVILFNVFNKKGIISQIKNHIFVITEYKFLNWIQFLLNEWYPPTFFSINNLKKSLDKDIDYMTVQYLEKKYPIKSRFEY